MANVRRWSSSHTSILGLALVGLAIVVVTGWGALAVSAAALVLVVVAWVSATPSNDRDWQPRWPSFPAPPSMAIA
jgi:uncharacterized protein (DUF58 family)